jgi:hypothetical protein
VLAWAIRVFSGRSRRFSLIALEAAASSDHHGVVMTRGPEGRVRIGVGKDMAPS